ncbi:hypothetical protein [Bradyrhizobium sp. SZCCHNRI1001]|uniref:hypothetical protein n=1 Tax=Bradyrhizobium sp. SZCCHNRI1001 TaxID=3057273 RepID=UPI0028ED0981|nr:hypothetical protein [Bradyrhizobium sp. SZCCHNRI1001]
MGAKILGTFAAPLRLTALLRQTERIMPRGGRSDRCAATGKRDYMAPAPPAPLLDTISATPRRVGAARMLEVA